MKISTLPGLPTAGPGSVSGGIVTKTLSSPSLFCASCILFHIHTHVCSSLSRHRSILIPFRLGLAVLPAPNGYLQYLPYGVHVCALILAMVGRRLLVSTRECCHSTGPPKPATAAFLHLTIITEHHQPFMRVRPTISHASFHFCSFLVAQTRSRIPSTHPRR